MQSQFDILSDDIKNCKQCPLSRLLPGGSHPIPFYGNINSKILFCGEAPGADETELNEPFVGRCGKFFNSILKNAGLDRDNILLLNSTKCRPWEYSDESRKFKKNRPPTQCEIDSCKNWLKDEINLLKPSLLFTLGKIPLKVIMEMGSNGVLKFNSNFKLKTYLYKTIGSLPLWPDLKIVPLYHPSYLLSYGNKKDIERTEQVIEMAANLI